MAESVHLTLADADATARLGAALARDLLRQRPAQFVLYVEGELGAGKTTLIRGLLRELGHEGRVPSPTYTLVEPYELAGYQVRHLDLYRLTDAAELEFLGIDDEFGGDSLWLLEWPERGAGRLPAPDLTVRLAVAGEHRAAMLCPSSVSGQQVIADCHSRFADK